MRNQRVTINCFKVTAISSSYPSSASTSYWKGANEDVVRQLVAEHERACRVKYEIISIEPHVYETYVWEPIED